MPPEKWRTSEAKKLLKADILAGKVSEESDPEAVFNSRPEYKPYPKTNFKTNLKNLIEACKKTQKAEKWANSKAKALLRRDILDN